jgi:type II secretory pathway pseudopilin PulG
MPVSRKAMFKIKSRKSRRVGRANPGSGGTSIARLGWLGPRNVTQRLAGLRSATKRLRDLDPPDRRAFTLVEALVAIGLTVLASSALLLGVFSAQQTADNALKRTIASGMAEQLLDEILGNRYCPVGATGHETTIGPSSAETVGPGRSRYTSIGAFNGYRAKPPKDPWNIPLGTDNGQGSTRQTELQSPAGWFDKWQQEVDVYYVSEADLETKQTAGTDYRMVEVRIVEIMADGSRQELAKRKQVVVYVPPLS